MVAWHFQNTSKTSKSCMRVVKLGVSEKNQLCKECKVCGEENKHANLANQLWTLLWASVDTPFFHIIQYLITHWWQSYFYEFFIFCSQVWKKCIRWSYSIRFILLLLLQITYYNSCHLYSPESLYLCCRIPQDPLATKGYPLHLKVNKMMHIYIHKC